MVVMKLRNVQNLNLLDLRQRILSCQDVCGRREQGRACQVYDINIFAPNHQNIHSHNWMVLTKSHRPLGPDGKPIPGPAEVRQIQAARKMAQQQAQVSRITMIMAYAILTKFRPRWTRWSGSCTRTWRTCWRGIASWETSRRGLMLCRMDVHSLRSRFPSSHKNT